MRPTKVVILLLAALTVSAALPAVATAAAPQRVETALQQPAQPSVQGANGRILFTAGSEAVVFSVYSITGQLVRTVKVAAEGHATVELPKGFYIVKCGTQGSRKVVVK